LLACLLACLVASLAQQQQNVSADRQECVMLGQNLCLRIRVAPCGSSFLLALRVGLPAPPWLITNVWCTPCNLMTSSTHGLPARELMLPQPVGRCSKPRRRASSTTLQLTVCSWCHSRMFHQPIGILRSTIFEMLGPQAAHG